MPSTVREVMEAAGTDYGGSVPWGSPVPETRAGIYAISMSSDPEAAGVPTPPPLSLDHAAVLIESRPELTIDRAAVTIDALVARLAEIWLPDETILYLGKATSLRSRIGQYYTTPLGARSPHAGGWPLKLLSNIDELWVHWVTASMPELAEQMALAHFVMNVSEQSRSSLHDPAHPYPYANLEGPGGRKRHGISGARAPGVTAATTSVISQPPPPKRRSTPPPSPLSPSSKGSSKPTQRVTEADMKAGRIRIPRGSKSIFPDTRGDIEVSLRGEGATVRWDPRMGPPERSGTLGIGKERLAKLVQANEVLEVRIDERTWTIF